MSVTSRSFRVSRDDSVLAKHVNFDGKAAYTEQPLAHVMARRKVGLDSENLATQNLNAARTPYSQELCWLCGQLAQYCLLVTYGNVSFLLAAAAFGPFQAVPSPCLLLVTCSSLLPETLSFSLSEHKAKQINRIGKPENERGGPNLELQLDK